MAKNILAIGQDLPNDEVEYTSLRSKLSLLDYDISIFNPDISDFYSYPVETYQGKRALDDTKSFTLKEQMNYWQREILEAVKAGKNVFILMNDREEVYVSTGEKTYSGRRETRHVSLFTNYVLIPGDIVVTSSKGTSMTLYGKNNVLAAYWTELESWSEFRILINDKKVKPLVTTKTGNKTVGAYVKYTNALGTLVLLPYIDFDRADFIHEKKGEAEWTNKAKQVGQQLVSAIVGVDKILRQGGEFTPAPEWLAQERFTLPKEKHFRKELFNLDAKLSAIQKQKERLQQDLESETTLKRLLYEKGKPLESAVLHSLKLVGFETNHYRDSESEFDVVFESEEGRLIGEVEGKDNSAVNIDKLRQLEMNIQEDFARDQVKEMAKGALIGNAYRLLPPDERQDFFTSKCFTAANRSKTALIRSVDLFYIAQYLSGKADSVFAKKCRKAILNASGIVVFPSIPVNKLQAHKDAVIEPNQ